MLETLQLSFKVTRRNWAIYQKDFIANILPTAVEPIFFLVCLGLGLGAYVNELDGRSYVNYIAPGLAMSTALFTSFFESSYNFYVRKTYEGIYHAMLTTPLSTREILIGEFFWMALKGAFMSLGVSLVLLAFGAVKVQGLLIIPFLGALVAGSCGSLGFIATAWVRNINQFQTVYTLLISPMFFFSGIFFPISDLPQALQYVAWLSPFYHGVSLGQMALWGAPLGSDFLIHLAVLLVMTVILVPFSYRRIYPLLYV